MRRSIKFVGVLMALVAMSLALAGCNNGSSGSDEPALPEGALTGAFSVSDGVQVHFSKGNLKATTTDGWATATWGFYDNQYDSNSLNTGPGRTASGSDAEIDLFTWGYNATKSVDPVGADSDNVGIASGNLDPATEDWGCKIGTPGTWRTLTTEEWQYLFNYGGYTNTTRAGLYACGVTVAGKTNCVVLYPDGWTGAKVGDGDTASYDTAEEWAIAEAAGAVCLPAAGYRYGTSVSRVGNNGYYWSSTANSSVNAYDLYFNGSYVYPAYYDFRYYGYAVRLVCGEN